MPQPLALAISVPLAAQIACGPLIVLIALNFRVRRRREHARRPAAPLGTILGLAACLCAGIPLLGSGLAALAWLPATWIAATATTFASSRERPALAGGMGRPRRAERPRRRRLRAGPSGTAQQRVAAAWTISAAIGVGLALGPVADVVDRAALPTQWSIAACDVGQGDAVLVRSQGATASSTRVPTRSLLPAVSMCWGSRGSICSF
jgi:competence protein ComEC